MNPAVNKATRGLGSSFKGVTAYLLTDKREVLEQARAEGREAPNRAGFIQARNLPSDDPQHAWRLMASTASRRDELKAQAGVSRAGRPTREGEFKPVFHYTLNWRADERPTEREMIATADRTLKVLGLQEHEALIVQHTDKDHPHLHIVVNRVHPETGRMATLGNNWLKLDREARDHERARGQIVSPNRDAKYRALERQEQPDRPKRWTTHQEHKRGPAHRALVDQVHQEHRGQWSALGKQKALERRDLKKALEGGDHHAFVRKHGKTFLEGYKDPREATARAHELNTTAGLTEALKRAHARQTGDLARVEKAEVRRREGERERSGKAGGRIPQSLPYEQGEVRGRKAGLPTPADRYEGLKTPPAKGPRQEKARKPETMDELLRVARARAQEARDERRLRSSDTRPRAAGDPDRSRDRERD